MYVGVLGPQLYGSDLLNLVPIENVEIFFKICVRLNERSGSTNSKRLSFTVLGRICIQTGVFQRNETFMKRLPKDGKHQSCSNQ